MDNIVQFLLCGHWFKNADFVFSFSFRGRRDLYIKLVPAVPASLLNVANSVGTEL